MRRRATFLAAAVLACSSGPEAEDPRIGAGSPDAAAYGDEVVRGYEIARAATEPFHTLDSAVAAGYSAEVVHCFTDSLHAPSHGGMGYQAT